MLAVNISKPGLILQKLFNKTIKTFNNYFDNGKFCKCSGQSKDF
jgi:hypothetical protein